MLSQHPLFCRKYLNLIDTFCRRSTIHIIMSTLHFAALLVLVSATNASSPFSSISSQPSDSVSLLESPSPTPSATSSVSPRPSLGASLSSPSRVIISQPSCEKCLRDKSVCPKGCELPKACIPIWSACTGPDKPPGTSNQCCKNSFCVQSRSLIGFVGKRCEPSNRHSRLQYRQDCTTCLRNDSICRPGCPKRCIPKWWICAGPNKNRNYSNTCCNGWQCVQPKNPNLRSKRCEPKPPTCVPKWGWRCSGSVRCCSGWRCGRATVKGYTGNRCEPPPRKGNCVPNWYHCEGPRNKLDTNICCGGWRCVLPRNATNFNGKRCEPWKNKFEMKVNDLIWNLIAWIVNSSFGQGTCCIFSCTACCNLYGARHDLNEYGKY